MHIVLPREVAEAAPLSDRVMFSSGTERVASSCPTDKRYQTGIFVPVDSWRPLDDDELATLVKSSRGQSILVFRVPGYLQRLCWDSGVVEAESSREGESPDSILIQAFTREARAVLRTVYSGVEKCTLQLCAPGRRSTTYDSGAGTFIGLHVDNFEQQPIDGRSTARFRLAVNLGREARSFIFINLELMDVLKACGLDQTREVFDSYRCAYSLGHLFMARFPEYPVTRLLLHPGEGYLAPTQNAIHDGYTVGMDGPDVMLHVVP